MKCLSDYIQDKQIDAIDELGGFFAFSDKQFAAAKKRGSNTFPLALA